MLHTVMEGQGMGGQGKEGPTSDKRAASPSSALLLLLLLLLLPVTRMLTMTDARDAAIAKHVRPQPMPFTHPSVFTITGARSAAAAAAAEAAAADTARRYASMSTEGDV
jgi:hypothetical protein